MDVGEYLDYENWNGRKRLIDKLIEKCIENIDENELTYNGNWNGHKMCVGLMTAVPAWYTLLFCDCNNKHWYWHCFYLFSLVRKKYIYSC